MPPALLHRDTTVVRLIRRNGPYALSAFRILTYVPNTGTNSNHDWKRKRQRELADTSWSGKFCTHRSINVNRLRPSQPSVQVNIVVLITLISPSPPLDHPTSGELELNLPPRDPPSAKPNISLPTNNNTTGSPSTNPQRRAVDGRTWATQTDTREKTDWFRSGVANNFVTWSGMGAQYCASSVTTPGHDGSTANTAQRSVCTIGISYTHIRTEYGDKLESRLEAKTPT